MPKHLVGNLKPNKVKAKKASHKINFDFVDSGKFGNKKGNKLKINKSGKITKT